MTVASASASQNHKWYIVQVYSGFEKSIVDEIKNLARLRNISDSFSDFYYPSKETAKVAEDQKIDITKRREGMLYPGYLFIKMNMTSESWDLVMKVGRVISFVGPNKLSPRPLTEDEYKQMIEDVRELAEKKDQKLVISVGDMVRIKDGSFQSLIGKVVEVDSEKNRIGITLKIFDRETTLDLDWSQVDKISQQ